MLDIGIIGLDTSHAEGFAPLIKETHDMTIHSVWDSNSVRDYSFTTAFADKYGAHYFDTIEKMVPHVDAAMILTVNWETHRPLATRFLEADIPIFVDKPLAGRYDDIQAIEAAADHTPLFGGSAVPFHPEIAALPRGENERTLFGAGFNDYFYYRVHMVDTVRLLADANWTDIRVTDSPGTRTEIRFENGTQATLRFDGSTENSRFGLLDIGSETRLVEIESNENSLAQMYDPFLDAFRSAILGNRNDTQRLIDSAKLLLGIEAALESKQTVTPDCKILKEVCRDGDAFLEGYEPYY